MVHNTITLVADCLDSLGFPAIASQARHTQCGEVLENFISLAESEAIKKSDYEVLQRLHFAGLIY